MSNKDIIDRAFELGFKLPEEITIKECRFKDGHLPTSKNVTQKITREDITCFRAKTAPMMGSKDLGEWWVSYPTSLIQFRVTDEDMANNFH